MDITQLVTLVHVAELGSLSKAADRLHIVQPALSRQIRMLEEELGVALFERHGRGMAITPVGEQVLEHAVRILAELDALRDSTSAKNASYRGLVRLGMTPTIGEVMTLPLMSEIHNEHPDLTLRFSSAFSGHLVDWLQRGELDLAISYDPQPTRALRIVPVLMETLYLVTAPDPEVRLDRPVRFRDLADRPFILPSPRHGLRTIVDHCASMADISLKTIAEMETMSGMIDLTRAGYGHTILPLAPLLSYLDAGRVSIAPLTDPVPQRRVVLCLPADRATSPAVRHVAETFREVAARLVKDDRWGGRMIS